MRDFQRRRLLLDAGVAWAEGFARLRRFGTPETVRRHAALVAQLLDEAMRPTLREPGWADAAQVDALVAALRAWSERPDALGGMVGCAGVG